MRQTLRLFRIKKQGGESLRFLAGDRGMLTLLFFKHKQKTGHAPKGSIIL